METDNRQGMLTTREAFLGSKNQISPKMIMNSPEQRAVERMLNGPPSSSPHRKDDDLVRVRLLRRGDDIIRMRSSSTLGPRRNPHVIYQFSSTLKAKRVDDNPKVLGSIIRKKFKLMEREDLFGYISGLVRRRET